MKKIAILFFLIFCPFLRANDCSQMLVFATPLEQEKAHILRESVSRNSNGHALFFQDLGVTAYSHWIQKMQGHDFLIHFLKGDNLVKSFELLKNKIEQNDETALQINQFCLETLGIDWAQKNFFANVTELTPMLQVDIEKGDGSFTKEYCFIYPILPDKEDKLQRMFQTESDYWSEQVQDVYRYRGISKQQLWIQEDDRASFLVIYQEITGPVTEARKKYLNSKDEEFSKSRSLEFSEVTGLSYEELLPKLESLVDCEVLD